MTTSTETLVETPPATELTETKREPFAVFPDSDSFEKRLDREVRKRLRESGVEDPTVLSTMVAEHKNMKESVAEAERAKLSEVERLSADLRARDEAMSKLQAEYEEKELRLRLHDVFSRKGVKNFEYGYFKIVQKANGLTEADEALDLDVFVDELLGDENEKHALGAFSPAPAAPPQQMRIAPPSTSPHLGGAPQPNPAGSPTPAKTAFDYDQKEWDRMRRERYGM